MTFWNLLDLILEFSIGEKCDHFFQKNIWQLYSVTPETLLSQLSLANKNLAASRYLI